MTEPPTPQPGTVSHFPENFVVLDSLLVAGEAEVGKGIIRRDPTDTGWYWHHAWIPLTADFAGDYLVYDCRPKQPYGAVFYRHQIEGPSGGSWPSLAALLEDTVAMLRGERPSHARPLPADRLIREGLGWLGSRARVDNGLLTWV
jgi:hypothetical protein